MAQTLICKYLSKEVDVVIYGFTTDPCRCLVSNYDDNYVEVKVLDGDNVGKTYLVPFDKCIIRI